MGLWISIMDKSVGSAPVNSNRKLHEIYESEKEKGKLDLGEDKLC